MSTTQQELLHALADGEPHSGQSLGERLGITRAAVWKHIKALRSAGLDIEGATGAGYRLKHPIRLLDVAAVQEAAGEAASLFDPIQLDYQVDSTNRLAMAHTGPKPAAFLAEQQTAGRGRRGRTWHSPLGASLYVSVAWPLDAPAQGLSGLSLVAGLALVEALHAACEVHAGLKWPNDVQVDGRKIAGILVELSGDPAGPCRVVIGIGVNCLLPEAVTRLIDQPWTDLYRETGATVDRNRLAGGILRSLASALPQFESEGFAAFHRRWQSFDVLRDQPVVLMLGERTVTGTALGVDPDGALRVLTSEGERSFSGGEVTVRRRS